MAPDGIAAIVTPGALAGAASDRGRTRGPGNGGDPVPGHMGAFDVTPACAGDICRLSAIYLVFILEGAEMAGAGDRYDPGKACGSCRGRYQIDWQPFTLQNTAMCPAAPPPLVARAVGQSHSTQDTVIRPGPHSCPFWQRSG
jgi:hypothetical protein